MRRRTREHPAGAPPVALLTFPGGGTREALGWIRDRDEWWTANRDADDPGWLAWLVDGWEQVDPLPWCGSVGLPCGDDDCLCVGWLEYRDIAS